MDIDPEMKAFAERADAWFDGDYAAKPLAEQRRIYAEFCRAFGTGRPIGLEVRELTVPSGVAAVPVRLYRPAGRGRLPAIIYLHGGGWVLGSPETHDSITAKMALDTEAAVISVDYRLAPEHPFPAAFDDGYAVLCEVAARPQRFGVDPARLALAGDSAGGNLAAAISLAARDRGGPTARLQALVYPAVSTDCDRPSCRENAEAPFLTRESLLYYIASYLGGANSTTDPYAAPLEAASHRGLPPAFIATAGIDPLRDDGALYAERLRLAGVEVECRCASRLVHGYLRAFDFCRAARGEFDALCAALRRHLG